MLGEDWGFPSWLLCEGSWFRIKPPSSGSADLIDLSIHDHGPQHSSLQGRPTQPYGDVVRGSQPTMEIGGPTRPGT